MTGYCFKSQGTEDFRTLYAACITDEHLQRAKHEYLVHGNILKSLGRCTLSPRWAPSNVRRVIS